MLRYITTAMVILFLSMISVASMPPKRSSYEWIDNAEHIYLIYNDNGHGTGFAVRDGDGRVFIVTNRHVCGFQGAALRMKDYMGRDYPVEKRWISRTTDLCAIEAPDTAVPLEMADGFQVGDHFMTAGYPLVQFMSQHDGHVIGERDSEPNWIAHYVPQELSPEQCKLFGSLEKYEENGHQQLYCRVLLTGVAVTDLFIGAGASGSPVISDDHEVIGVIYGGRSLGGPVVLASFIRVELLRDFLKSIR